MSAHLFNIEALYIYMHVCILIPLHVRLYFWLSLLRNTGCKIEQHLKSVVL